MGFEAVAEGKAWTEEAVRDLLTNEPLRYQQIRLPYGLTTGGEDRSSTASRVLPADMSGQSVLDVGCRLGYFCFESARRGASRVLGVDVDPELVRRARALADCLGANVSFRESDVQDSKIPGRFDYVLCLNVLHHFRDPVAILEKLARATRRQLVLEVAGFGRRDRRRLGVPAPLALLMNRMPVALIRSPRGSRKKPGFFLTPPAVKVLLERAGDFERIEIMRSEHKQRFIAIATKRGAV